MLNEIVVAFDFAVGDLRFAGVLAIGFAGQLGAVLLERERALDRAVRPFGRALPIPRNVGRGGGKGEKRHQRK